MLRFIIKVMWAVLPVASFAGNGTPPLLLQDGKVWNYDFSYVDINFNRIQGSCTYWIDGDTIVGGSKLFWMCNTDTEKEDVFKQLWYEEAGKVYICNDSGIPDRMVYDFSLSRGDEIPESADNRWDYGSLEVLSTDTILVHGIYRKRLQVKTKYNEDVTWVEGIGNPGRLDEPVFHMVSDGREYALVSCYVGDDCVFEGSDFDAPSLKGDVFSCPDNNHPHAIDLGLPSGTKWACCNVGTATPEGCGGYYAWGETEEKEIYDWATYIHCDGSMETCHDIGSDIAGTEYDVAHIQWGGSWVMPSQGQIKELTSECSCAWISKNGVNGNLFTGPNGETVFLPEADFRGKGSVNSAVPYSNNGDLNRETDEKPSAGYYWSSTLRPLYPNVASYLLFSNGIAYGDACDFRYSGFTVRPVIGGTNNMTHIKPSFDDTSQAIYNIYGIKVTDTMADMNTLPSGIYIKNGRKYLK